MTENIWTINGKDARKTWGITFAEGSLSALQTPAPLKKPVINSSRIANGQQLLRSDKVDARDVSLLFNLSATSIEEFNSRYKSFMDELYKDIIILESTFDPGKKYRLNFDSCTQYKVYCGTLAKFTIKFNEPDPTNRS